MTDTATKPLDSGTRLAIERTQLAHERTLMAWIRTALSLISFGFTIYKFFEFESGRGAVAASGSRLLTPRQFGILMISTGLAALMLGAIEYHRSEVHFQLEFGTSGRSVALIVATIVAFLGLVALVAAFFRG